MSGSYPPPESSAARPASADGGMPHKRRRTENIETESYDGADVSYQHSLKTRDPEEIKHTVRELDQNWSVSSDLKRYLYHTTPEEFVKRINSLISPDMAATIVSSLDAWTKDLVYGNRLNTTIMSILFEISYSTDSFPSSIDM